MRFIGNPLSVLSIATSSRSNVVFCAIAQFGSVSSIFVEQVGRVATSTLSTILGSSSSIRSANSVGESSDTHSEAAISPWGSPRRCSGVGFGRGGARVCADSAKKLRRLPTKSPNDGREKNASRFRKKEDCRHSQCDSVAIMSLSGKRL